VVIVMSVSVVRAAAAPPRDFDTYKACILLFRNATTFIPYLITVMMVRNRRDSKRLFWAVVVGLIAESAATVFFGEWTSGGRAKGTMNQPNALGAYLSISIVLVGAFLLAQRNVLAWITALGATLLGIVANLQAASRGAMIAVVVGLAYVAIRSSRVLTVI